MTAKWEQPGTILSLLREVLAALVVGLVLLGPACATSRHEVAAPKLNRPAQQIQLPIVCRDIDLSDQASPPRLTDLCDYNLETVWTLTKADGPEEQWIRFGFDHAIVLSRIVVFLEGLAGLGVSTPATGHSQTFKQDELQFDSIVVYLDNKKTDDLRITAWRDTSAGGSPASYISEVHLYGWEPADEIPLALIARSVSTSSQVTDSTQSAYESSGLNVLDGDWRTTWTPSEASQADSHWVHIDLDREVRINRVTLLSGFRSTVESELPDLKTREFDISLSDGSSHVVMLTGDRIHSVSEFEPVVTSWIRVATSARTVDGGQIVPALAELKAYGATVVPAAKLSVRRSEEIRAAIASSEERLRLFEQHDIDSFAHQWSFELASYARQKGLLMTDDAGEGNLLSVHLLFASGKEGLNLLKEMVFYSQEHLGLQLSDVYLVLAQATEDKSDQPQATLDSLWIPILWRAAHFGENSRTCAAYALLCFNDTRAIRSLVEHGLLQVCDDTLVLFDDECTHVTFEQAIRKHRNASTDHYIRRLLSENGVSQSKIGLVLDRLLEEYK